MTASAVEFWNTARGAVPLAGPAVVGILNVTPDSFSDGGRYLEPHQALSHARRLLDQGAHVLDVGAESTRPGAARISAEEEWARLAPVIERIVADLPNVPLSVDTIKSVVARRALDAGAWIINDVTGLRADPEMANVCAAKDAGVIIMHSRGTPDEIASYRHAEYHDLVGEVVAELDGLVNNALLAGIAPEKVVVDPGLGFGKRPEQNFAILDNLPAFASLGFPIMVGPSRKRFLRSTGDDIEALDQATARVCASALSSGARLFRVHDVELVCDVLGVRGRGGSRGRGGRCH